MNVSPVDRLIALVRRELGADEVSLHGAADDALAAGGSVSSALPDGRRLVASFAVEPPDRDARQRRLDMLVASFRTLLSPPPSSRDGRGGVTLDGSSPSNRAPAVSLCDALRALRDRASAVDALVIDAQSPILWGAANWVGENQVSEDEDADHRLLPLTQDELPLGTPCRSAVDEVRALAAVATLHKGGTLHHSAREGDRGYIARSFAAIYVLVIVFDGTFDELRAERAILASLPTIERLVLALPPLDPSPEAGSAAVVRRRRR